MTKNDNFKEYGMPVVVLVAICFVTTLLLALTNSVSEPIIIRNAAITATENRKELLPDADDFTQLDWTAMRPLQTIRLPSQKFTRQTMIQVMS